MYTRTRVLYLRHLGQNFCPIWSTGICASLQPGYQVLLLLFVHQVDGQLEDDSFHISALKGGGDVHVHLEEPAELPPVLLLLGLQLGEQVDKPLKALLVSVNPDEVNFFEIEHASLDCVGPTVAAAGACVLDIKVPVCK